MTEEDLLEILDNNTKFQSLIPSLDSLLEVRKNFPQYTNALVSYVLNKPKEFRRMIIDTDHLCTFLHSFPEQGNAIISYLLLHNKEFDRVIEDAYALAYVANKFPKYREALLFAALQNPDFNWDIEYLYLLKTITLAFPNREKTLFSIYIEESDYLEVETGRKLHKIVHAFPKHEKAIITRILNDTEKHKKLVSFFTSGLESFISALGVFPNCRELILSTFLKSAQDYRYFIKQYEHLLLAAKWIPERSHAFMWSLLGDFENFKDYFTSQRRQKLSIIFPCFNSLFLKPTQEDIKHALTIYLQLGTLWQTYKKAKLLGSIEGVSLKRAGQSFFQSVPKETQQGWNSAIEDQQLQTIVFQQPLG